MAENKGSNEIAVIDTDVVDEETKSTRTDVAAVIQSMSDPNQNTIYSSIVGDSFATKLEIAAAMTTSVPVDEHLGEVINLRNFIIQPVELTDDNGTINTAPRVILIDDDGTTFHGTSVGLLSALRNIVAVVGEPVGWDSFIPIQVVQEKTRKGFKVFTIKFV